MSNRGQREEIEAYLTGQMSEAERQAFEQRLLQDKVLADAYELQKLEHQSMEVLIERDLRLSMQSWKDAPPVNPFENDRDSTLDSGMEKDTAQIIPMPSRRRQWIWIAAAIATVIISIFGISRYLRTPDNLPIVQEDQQNTSLPVDTLQIETPSPVVNEEQEIVTSPSSPTPPAQENTIPKREPNKTTLLALAAYEQSELPDFASNLKSGIQQQDTAAIVKAATRFDAGDYRTALDLLGPPQAEDQSDVRFLRGHLYLRLKQYKEAVPEFAYIAADELRPKHEEARWFLLLSYLADFDSFPSEFAKLAEELASDEFSPYQQEVVALLKKLEEN